MNFILTKSKIFEIFSYWLVMVLSFSFSAKFIGLPVPFAALVMVGTLMVPIFLAASLILAFLDPHLTEIVAYFGLGLLGSSIILSRKWPVWLLFILRYVGLFLACVNTPLAMLHFMRF